MSDALLEQITSKLVTLTIEQKQQLQEKLQRQLGQSSKQLEEGRQLPGSLDSLSHAQIRLWILEQYNHCAYLYHIPLIMTLPKDTDSGLLEKAFSCLIKENLLLSNYFVFENSLVKQYKDESCQISLQTFTLEEDLPQFVELSLSSPLQNFFMQKFSLNQAPLFRASLVKTPKNMFLMLCFHHIIMDGWSINLVIQRLNFHYTSLKNAVLAPVQPAQHDYAEFIEWEKLQKNSAEQIEYWVERLSGKSLVIDIMTDYPHQVASLSHGKTLHKDLPETLVQKLQMFAKSLKVSLNQLILFAFQFMLSRYSGQNQITVGIPVAGRAHPQWYQTIGLFVNTCLHSVLIDYEKSVCEQLVQFKELLLMDLSASHVPFDEIVKALYTHQKIKPSRIFNVLYNYIQLETEGNQITFADTACNLHYCALPVSKFDLSLHVYATPSKLDVFMEFNSELYQENTIQQMLHYMLDILKLLPLHHQKTLKDLTWIQATQPVSEPKDEP